MCLADDIWPRADRPVWSGRDSESTPADHLSLICYCPAAEHDGRKLQISVGRFKRILSRSRVFLRRLAVLARPAYPLQMMRACTGGAPIMAAH